MCNSIKDIEPSVNTYRKLTYEQEKSLKQAARQNSDTLLAQRASAVLVYYKVGGSAANAVKANQYRGTSFCRFKLEEDFIRRTVHRYEDGNRDVESLKDKPRSGRPVVYGDDVRMKIVETFLSESPEAGWSYWSATAISQHTGINYDLVCRVLREYGLNPYKVEVRCNSNDPKFHEKCQAIIECYTSPKQGERVVCVDEKTSIQSLEEKQGFIVTSRRKKAKIIKGKSSTYVRHGTTNLIAGLDVHLGVVYGEMRRCKDSKNFIEFITNLIKKIREQHPNDSIVFIFDNYRVHKSKEFKDFQTTDIFKNCRVLFTPVSASWINHIERFFSTLSRKVLKHNRNFCNDIGVSDEYALLPAKGQARKDALNELYVKTLEAYILRFIDYYNENDAKPYKWRSVKIKNGQLRPVSSNMLDTPDYYGSSYELACKAHPSFDGMSAMFSKEQLDDYFKDQYPARVKESA